MCFFFSQTRDSLQREWEKITAIEEAEQAIRRAHKQQKKDQRAQKRRIYKKIKVS